MRASTIWPTGKVRGIGWSAGHAGAAARYDRIRMMQRITEPELARDVLAVLANVKQGNEVVVEGEDHRPVAVISAPRRSGRPITDILHEARTRKSSITLDDHYGKDMEEIIAAHRTPWNPPSWD